jgi:hypothetical protein
MSTKNKGFSGKSPASLHLLPVPKNDQRSGGDQRAAARWPRGIGEAIARKQLKAARKNPKRYH